MDGKSLGERLQTVRERVANACARSGRPDGSVNVLAVSKLHSRDLIRAAYEAGQMHFAENYVQEAVDKMHQLHSLPVHWHFIGRIQSNKVKFLTGRFEVIHSIDREPIADHLNRLPHKTPQKILLQYNVANEASKAGADDRNLETLAQFVIEQCSNLSVLGLMAMPPLDVDASPFFERTRKMLERLKGALTAEQKAHHPMDQLSMGTSNDFESAIAEGATWVRIGTEIFGPREEKT